MNRLKAFDYEFEDSKDLKTIVEKLLYELNYEEKSQANNEIPITLFEKEKEYLKPVNFKLLENYNLPEKTYKVSNESMINYHGIKYSVPIKYVDKNISVLEEDNVIHLYYSKNLICSYKKNSKYKYNYKETDDLDIFNFETIGYNNAFGESFLHYYVDAYKKQSKNNETILEEDGNAVGINYDDVDTKIISQFMNLIFKEKLDLISELFIRIDNETYFKALILPAPLSLELSGFNIASIIKKYKNNI